MKKRILSACLAAVLMLGMLPGTAFAADEQAKKSADILYELGLFSGTGTDVDGNPIYDLERVPTRHEAITMLVGLLGKYRNLFFHLTQGLIFFNRIWANTTT